MEDRILAPDWLHGVNYPKPEKVQRIAAKMKAHGWNDRPLLIEEGLHGQLVAWTGSHRIEAAKLAGIRDIPCQVITHAESQAALERLPDTVGLSSLRDALTKRSNGGGPRDHERLEGLRRLGGLDVAAAALELEIASAPG
jgi:ParB-like chromosome segregation protein Spo0J